MHVPDNITNANLQDSLAEEAQDTTTDVQAYETGVTTASRMRQMQKRKAQNRKRRKMARKSQRKNR